MTTVYIVQNDRRKNFDNALKFGELKDIFSTVIREYQADRIVAHVRSVLENSCKDDYLLMVGDPVLCGVAIQVMADLHGVANVLRWDRDMFVYKPLTLIFYQD